MVDTARSRGLTEAQWELVNQRMKALKVRDDSALARLIGVKPQTVWKWRRGQRHPSVDAWNDLAEKLGIPIAQFADPVGYAQAARSAPFEVVSGVVGAKTEARSAFEALPVYDGWGAARVLSGVDANPDPVESRFPPEGFEDEIGPNGLAVIVRGESMAGWARRPILDGDRCWVNPHDPFRGRGVVAVVVRETEDSEPKCLVKFHDGDNHLYSVPASGVRELLEVYEILSMARVIVVESPPGEP